MADKDKDFIVLLVIVAVLLLFVPMLLWGLWGVWGGHMHGMMGYGWGFMSLIPFTFLVLIVLGVYFLLKEFTSGERAAPSQSQGQSERALDILKERYAKGEITREDYTKMKEELES